MIIPTVTENIKGGVRSSDLFSRLLTERIIFLSGDINDKSANLVIAQLLYLDADNSKKDIKLYINSPGGSVTSTMAIIDTMNFIKADVTTVCLGLAASGAAIILAAGAKGKRFMLKNSEVMIHQPLLTGMQGQETDVAIVAENMKKTRTRLNKILAKITNKPIKIIDEDTERDKYMTAEDSKKYGLIDKVL